MGVVEKKYPNYSNLESALEERPHAHMPSHSDASNVCQTRALGPTIATRRTSNGHQEDTSSTRHRQSGTTSPMTMTSVAWLFLASVVLATSSWTLPTAHAQREAEGGDSSLAASLAFVFDKTGSMYDDLQQVIQGAGEILDDARKRFEKPLQNYVLVPFHDPVIGPVLVTEDADEFQRELGDIYVQGGGDCPEMSIGAIKRALELSLPHSFIYVFTDARSKDYYLTDEVLTLIQQKQSQVVFVLTGDCGDVYHSGYKAYEEIAATSSGQVFLLDKSQVNQVLNFVRDAVQARKVNLLAVNQEEGRTSTYNLPIDTHLKEITVSISGENRSIQLVDPEGNLKTRLNGLNVPLNLSNVLILNVKAPAPGTWRLRVSSSSGHTVRVTGLSHADFVSGFSKHPTSDMTRTTLRPIQGIDTNVLINTTGIFHPAELEELELIDLRGLPIAKYPLDQDPYSPTLYSVTPFTPPDTFFYVKVTGRDDLGFAMQRITPTAISPIKARKPRVFMREITRGIHDKTAVLTCEVYSLVPYTVQWWYRDKQKGYDLFFGDSSNVTLSIQRASKSDEGLYSCNVTNKAGYSDAVTFLDVTEPPPMILPAANVSVMPGESAILNCEIFSTVRHNVTWRKPDNIFWSPSQDRRVRALGNGSLVIRNVRRRDEGGYTCVAANEGGETSESVFLKLKVAPFVRVPVRQQTFVAGSTRNFSCSATGHPEPTFLWQHDGEIIEQSPRISYDVTTGTILFRNLGPGDQGDYECVASNSAGSSSAFVRLTYIEAPRVREFDRRVLVAVGDDATLHCVADGIPLPNTTWYRSDRMLMSAYNVEVNPLGQLIIEGVQDSDAGDYRCVVQNEAGSDSASLVLEVGAPPEIVDPPKNVGIDIETNKTLTCQAIGRPPPKLTWRRGDGKPIDQSGRFRQLPSGSLEIYGILPGDEGIYTCIAQNPFGLADAAAYVSVTGIVRPLISYTQPFVKAIEGDSAELECMVLLGKPTPTLTWMRKGKILRESANVRFTEPGRVVITNVDKTDDGDYVCMASNIGGNETYNINLNVLIPPRLVVDNEVDRQTNFSVIQGRSVFLPCTVTADPGATFTWFKDGRPISLADVRYYIRGDGALEIFSADVTDAARYKCVASNVAGEVEKNLELGVQVAPRISGSLDETIEININESVLLPCDVIGTPTPTVKWSKNFSPLNGVSAGRIQIQSNGLYITKAGIEDKAIYDCLASNSAGDANKMITLIVYDPPTLDPGPTDVTVLYGLEVTLECEANGDPAPNVLWKKDGVILDVDDPERGYYTSLQGSLTIASATLRDAGRYSCTAANPAGVASRQFTLSVLGAPEINGQFPEYVDVVEYNPLVLPCPAEGTPPPKVTWFKDGQELTGEELGLVQLDDGSLEIRSSQAEDSGNYRCMATNVAGIAERSVTVKVLVPPKLAGSDGLSGGTDRVSVIAKNNVTLICPVSPDTDPAPFITWYKDRKPITESERVFLTNQERALTITFAELDDEARYNCKAVNPAGEVEKNFDLDVQVPPKLDEAGVSPFNQSVIAGQTLFINCPYQGKPPPKVTWMKDGLIMPLNRDPNIRFLAEGRRLEVTNARVTDRGRFVCVGENIAGRNQRDFIVNVFVAPTVEGAGVPERPEAIETTTVYMTCPASGLPLPKITWFRQEIPIKQNTSKVSLLDGGWTLEIRDTNSTDATRYFCKAENVAGDTEKIFDLKVLLRPVIDREDLITDITIKVNSTALINCPVSGDPTPEVSWYKNNVPLDATNQPRYEVLRDGRQLRIYSAQLTDTGIYTCSARSRAGEDTIDYEIRVYLPPMIDINVNINPRALVDSTVVINCPAQGVPPPEITWLKDGQPLVEEPGVVEVRSDGAELVLYKAKTTDTGSYGCVATNPAGQTSKTFLLDVQVTPIISIEGVETRPNVIESRRTVLECLAQGTPQPDILWFHNNLPVDGETRTDLTISEDGRRLVITSTQVTDAGAYKCVATNEAGEADQDFDLTVWVPPVADTLGLEQSPRVIKGQTAFINCPVSGIPFPTITWTKKGQPVVEDARVQILNEGLQLRIARAEESDTDQYACVASNPAGEVKLDFDLTVLVPPSMDESNVVFDRKVSVGRTVQMECPVEGIPVPEVSWLLNGNPVEDFSHVRVLPDSRVLEIEEVSLSDSARYTCIATNEAGQLERNFDLDVLLRPTIDKASVQTKLVVNRNRTIRFSCPASGTPQPKITWRRHGRALRESVGANLRILDNGRTLELIDTQLEDAGDYLCTATNDAGVDKLKFELKVFVLPTINKPTPDRLYVIQGRSISMRCSAEGTPKPTILWLNKGVLVVDDQAVENRLEILEEGASLQLTDAQPEDAGRYTCHAENEAGLAEKIFDLEVYEPAKINSTEDLVKVPVVLNEEVILSCPATGTPSPTIDWMRKGQLIPDYGMPNIRIQDNGRQLMIMSAQLLDFGDYTCVASNEAGEDRLQFRVSIMVPPEIQAGPESVAEIVNSRAVLQCEASGQPTPQVTWTKDGEYFPATGLRHRMLPSGTLELMLVRLEDEGSYTCTASNAAGNVSRTIALRIQIPAKISGRRNVEVKAAQGQEVMLTCEVEGSPPPTIIWLKYNGLLKTNNRLRVLENDSLHISNLRQSDEATYRCLAQNNAGTDRKRIVLRVEKPPEIYVGPREFSVLQNRTIVLPCQVSGDPPPKIRWEKEGQEITTTRDYSQNYGRVHFITLQTGELAIPHTRAEDAGTFTCVASNSAGETRMDIALKVQVPPMIERSDRQVVVSVGERVTLPCVTSGNPKPRILWTRNRRRIDDRRPRYTIAQDGSLTIENISPEDTGNYVCTAENNVGKATQSRLLRVQVPPVFITRPADKELTINSNFQLTCVARGVPMPAITWMRNGKPLAAPPSVNGVSTLTVSSAMKEDAGEYTCVATNPASEQSVTSSARVLIKVPPRVIVPPGDWAVRIAEKVVLDCTVGGDPPPQIIWTKNGRPVELNDRIQKLANGSLVIYDLVSSDAGQYKCIAINDAGTSEAQSILTVKSEPKFKIEPVAALVELGDTVIFDCVAEGVPAPTMYWWKGTQELESGGRITVLANNSLRIVATQQSDVGLYRCFATNALGKTFVETELDLVVNGEYSDWAAWSPCSASCGRGERVRTRTCDNPAPGNGGRDCVGPSTEYATCTQELCPVHGNWSPWGLWSDCSLTCGGGQRRRFRSCSNPPPSGSGQPCPGSGEETQTCNTQGCPVDGRFSEWSTWSECSQTCGQAVKERYRQCREPSNGGRRCRGDTVEVMDCTLEDCSTVPVRAEGNLIGYVNNVDIADGTIVATMTPIEDAVRVEATVKNVPPLAANHIQHLISLLTPVYWTTAHEIGGAYNGYTLTKGEFMREVQVEFATGEILKMSHYGNGIHQNGVLLFDIIIRGEVPDLGQMTNVHLAPYQEEYIQTGPDTVYAHSSRLFRVDGATLPYAWNHTITYDQSRGPMPFLVQQLNTRAMDVTIQPDQRAVRFQLEAWIAPGEPSNRCPAGFTHDTRESFCRDDDECVRDSPCSHSCHNSPGGFSCSCPIGFLLTSDARTCQDIDECSTGLMECGPGMECLNTQGSYRCVTVCSRGFERELGGDRCVDTNECESNPSICEHACQNLVGSYRCSCLPGFTPGENGRCTDIDECERSNSPCSHNCINVRGSYRCACPPGYRLLNGRLCRDINECYEGHSCSADQECVNNEGSYHCVRLCPPGFRRTESGRCQDIDECRTRQHRCYYNQRCVNTEGSYRCDCPKGFTSRGPGQPCIDIDECRRRPCKYGCRNLIGGFQCLCPLGQLLLADRKSCAGLEYIEPGRVLPRSDNAGRMPPQDAPDFRSLRDFRQTFLDATKEQALHSSSSSFPPSPGHYRPPQPRQRRSGNRKRIKKNSEPQQKGFARAVSPPLSTRPHLRQPPVIKNKKRLEKNVRSAISLVQPRRGQKNIRSKRSALTYQIVLNQKDFGKRNRSAVDSPAGAKDRNECRERPGICQHNCTNVRGSYRCTCPPGYRLGNDGYSCHDIDECLEERIDCGAEKMCFNHRGSYSCIDIPCPPDYARDPTTNFCVLECVSPDIPCPPGAKYADIIEFRTVALPGGQPARQDLIRLSAYNQHNEFLPQTIFTILKNDPKLEFLLRPEGGKGIVYTMSPLIDNSTYQITVRARSYDHSRRHIQYQTTFIIYISVSAFPY